MGSQQEDALAGIESFPFRLLLTVDLTGGKGISTINKMAEAERH